MITTQAYADLPLASAFATERIASGDLAHSQTHLPRLANVSMPLPSPDASTLDVAPLDMNFGFHSPTLSSARVSHADCVALDGAALFSSISLADMGF